MRRKETIKPYQRKVIYLSGDIVAMDDDFLNRQPPEIRELLLSEGFFPEQLVRRRARANGEGTIRQRADVRRRRRKIMVTFIPLLW